MRIEDLETISMFLHSLDEEGYDIPGNVDKAWEALTTEVQARGGNSYGQ